MTFLNTLGLGGLWVFVGWFVGLFFGGGGGVI